MSCVDCRLKTDEHAHHPARSHQDCLWPRPSVRGRAGITYGTAFERHRIGMTSATLPVSGLPAALDGLRIGLITDIHHSRLVPAVDVVQALELAMSARPDLIVLGGDYVTFGDRAFVGPVAELLASLRAPHGVFAILGNHDDDRDMPAALAEQGIHRAEGSAHAVCRFAARR